MVLTQAGRPLDGDEQKRTPVEAAVLEMRDVVRGFGSRSVLTGASLRLQPGKVTWLGGPNGAGKTTLLRIAAGLLAPQSGEVSLDGLDPARDRAAYGRRLGFLSAGDRGLYARLSVLQNLQFWAGTSLVPRARRSDIVAAALTRFELTELARERVDRRSMGQRQRVRLAMTFLHEPDVVLLDEPHTSLDEQAMALLDAALGELTARGGAALWCSPAHVGVPLRADVRLWLEDGKVSGG